VRLRARTDIRRRQITPEGYPDLLKAIEALDDFAETSLRAVKGGAR
jgi:hypothetical protein